MITKTSECYVYEKNFNDNGVERFIEINFAIDSNKKTFSIMGVNDIHGKFDFTNKSFNKIEYIKEIMKALIEITDFIENALQNVEKGL